MSADIRPCTTPPASLSRPRRTRPPQSRTMRSCVALTAATRAARATRSVESFMVPTQVLAVLGSKNKNEKCPKSKKGSLSCAIKKIPTGRCLLRTHRAISSTQPRFDGFLVGTYAAVNLGVVTAANGIGLRQRPGDEPSWFI